MSCFDTTDAKVVDGMDDCSGYAAYKIAGLTAAELLNVLLFI
jgi:hypothetical protein